MGRPVLTVAVAPCVERYAEPAVRERFELRAPVAASAADAVQEEEQRRIRGSVDVGGERRLARDADGFDHASSGARLPSTTTGTPSSVIVQWRTGRSKWPSVWRPAKGFAPVENRKLPANARCSMPLVCALS